MTNKDILLASIAAQKEAMQAEFDATSKLIEQLPEGSPLKIFALSALEKVTAIINRLEQANNLLWKEDPAALDMLNSCVQDNKDYQTFLQGMPQ